MEEKISGFKVRGTWGAIVEHGEKITHALRDVDAHLPSGDPGYPVEFAEWDEWRPKAHEILENDVSEKTAEQASVDEGEGEKIGKSSGDDLEEASEKLTESVENLEDDDVENAVDNAGESTAHVARAADTAGRKALRAVEETVYEKVMTQVAPYYFDNKLISANIQHELWGDGERFTFEVNVNGAGLKMEVSDRLAEYEDTIERWHIATERETDVVEAAEGAEPPETDPDDQSRPTAN